MRRGDADPTAEDVGLDELQIDYEIRGAVGYPNREVVEIASDLDVDMLFIGGQRRSPTGKAVFGDYAQ